ncbi:hypothetical protein FPRO04_07530 [Fusarium proliferatum]|nr:hypothetical protein FPRO03_13162 [Fusarium proliferatum]KAG4277233.1 hypothetical protein FPRO04_07530 [Fusarium proliferatum]
MAKITVTLDSADIDPLDTGARRQYMNVFLASTPISISVIDEAYTKAIELQSKHLAERGIREVSTVYFEYCVDMTQWNLITNLLMITKNNPWPWTVSIDERDLSQGASPIFRDWYQSRGLGGDTQESISNGQPQVTPRSQQAFVPQTFAEAQEMALEARERANRVELEALRFERILRHWPVDSSRHDTYSDQVQTSGAPGSSSSGDHIRADSPRDLQDAAADLFPPLDPGASRAVLLSDEMMLQDTEVCRAILRRL